MRLHRETNDSSFPTAEVFGRLGPKNDRIAKVLDHCRTTGTYDDVVRLLEDSSRASDVEERDKPGEARINYGFVYLARGHPGEYKLGRTNLVDRRVPELGVASPVELTLVHEIKTDDPVGVDAYWHRRFADKRLRGEWFRLSAADVRDFKRWRRIF